MSLSRLASTLQLSHDDRRQCSWSQFRSGRAVLGIERCPCRDVKYPIVLAGNNEKTFRGTDPLATSRRRQAILGEHGQKPRDDIAREVFRQRIGASTVSERASQLSQSRDIAVHPAGAMADVDAPPQELLYRLPQPRLLDSAEIKRPTCLVTGEAQSA